MAIDDNPGAIFQCNLDDSVTLLLDVAVQIDTVQAIQYGSQRNLAGLIESVHRRVTIFSLNRVSSMKFRTSLLAMLLLLGACGNKGALYLPSQTAGNPAADGSQATRK
jgi:predicted small lipoprotein YifL